MTGAAERGIVPRSNVSTIRIRPPQQGQGGGRSVQAWFDALPTADKNRLGEWLTMLEWDTCVALSAAAGDWHRSTCVSHDK